MFLFEEPACTSCQKKIEENEEVYVKLVYPKKRGMTEVKAWLRNEGRLLKDKMNHLLELIEIIQSNRLKRLNPKQI